MQNINQYIIGDNLKVLQNIDIEFDFCYIDPPYNTGRDFGDFGDSFDSMESFVEFLKQRFELIHKKLKENGNLVVHVDSISSHYVKVCLDSIFGISNFRNELILTTSNMKQVKNKLMRSHDVILVYTKNKNKVKYNQQYTEYNTNQSSNLKQDERGYYVTSAAKNSQPNVVVRPNLRYEWNGHTHQWWISKEKMQKLHDENRLEYNKQGVPRIKRYLKELKGIPFKDVWTDISSIQKNEKLDYATQKPVKLLERLLDLYTNEGDICLDIFAGSGTMGRACLTKNRKFVLVDINEKGKQVFESSISSTLYKFT
jgi:site-specific DNA-methyltransferase (adenine-specific)